MTLQRLDLSHNEISDIVNLSSLICLVTVNLSANHIFSLGGFKEFTTVSLDG